jgi:hypothetical protein
MMNFLKSLNWKDIGAAVVITVVLMVVVLPMLVSRKA